jgi:HAD superfamily hydrolase (TIGR01490 family)
LALFDLDHTLLDGDTDVLWCDFLIDQGLLDRETFAARNAEVERGYRDGSITPADFTAFFVGTLAGRTPEQWRPLRDRFIRRVIEPRLPEAAHALVGHHREAGDLLVLTTATNRFLTEPTAALLGIEHLIATECEVGNDGRFTGKTAGTLNMRDGKVQRLRVWLKDSGLEQQALDSVAYSDSMNDLPLLRFARRAVVVNPDQRLAAVAATEGWPSIEVRL